MLNFNDIWKDGFYTAFNFRNISDFLKLPRLCKPTHKSFYKTNNLA